MSYNKKKRIELNQRKFNAAVNGRQTEEKYAHWFCIKRESVQSMIFFSYFSFLNFYSYIRFIIEVQFLFFERGGNKRTQGKYEKKRENFNKISMSKLYWSAIGLNDVFF